MSRILLPLLGVLGGAAVGWKVHQQSKEETPVVAKSSKPKSKSKRTKTSKPAADKQTPSGTTATLATQEDVVAALTSATNSVKAGQLALGSLKLLMSCDIIEQCDVSTRKQVAECMLLHQQVFPILRMQLASQGTTVTLPSDEEMITATWSWINMDVEAKDEETREFVQFKMEVAKTKKDVTTASKCFDQLWSDSLSFDKQKELIAYLALFARWDDFLALAKKLEESESEEDKKFLMSLHHLIIGKGVPDVADAYILHSQLLSKPATPISELCITDKPIQGMRIKLEKLWSEDPEKQQELDEEEAKKSEEDKEKAKEWQDLEFEKIHFSIHGGWCSLPSLVLSSTAQRRIRSVGVYREAPEELELTAFVDVSATSGKKRFTETITITSVDGAAMRGEFVFSNEPLGEDEEPVTNGAGSVFKRYEIEIKVSEQ